MTAAERSPLASRRIPILLLTVAALVALGTVAGQVITGSAHSTLFRRLDGRTKTFVLYHQHDRLLEAMARITDLGDRHLAWVPALIGGLVLSALWRRWWPLATCLVAYGGALVITAAVKALVARGDPKLTGLQRIAYYQFPSGHTVVATAVYLTLALLVAASLRAPLAKVIALGCGVAPVFAVAASRVYLGYHWATDALAGLVLGGAWVAVLCWPLRTELALRRPAGAPTSDGPTEADGQTGRSAHQLAVAASASAGGVNGRQPR